jgi:hypothetical protein
MRYAIAFLGCFAFTSLAAPRPPAKGADMDYGPFLSYSVLKPQKPQPKLKPAAKKAKPLPGDPTPRWPAGDLLATKGIVVKLPNNAAICFDTDTCRYAAGWTGGWLDVTKCNLSHNQGPLPAIAKGTLIFSTADAPGWAKNGSFTDPRPPTSDPRLHTGQGPLPRDWAHYRGLYRDGDSIVFSYTVGGVEVLDMPGSIQHDGETLLTRTIRIQHSENPLTLRVADDPAGEMEIASKNGEAAGLQHGPTVLTIGLSHDSEYSGVKVRPTGKTAIDVQIPPVKVPLQFTLLATTSPTEHLAAGMAVMHKTDAPTASLAHYINGGPALWPQEIEGSGTIAPDKAAYVIDSAPLPSENPWKSWIKTSAFDFFSDGRCAMCTLNGDVWTSTPLVGDLKNVTTGRRTRRPSRSSTKWKRFAAGLYEPLGLKIVDGKIYVLGRDQITILHDLNNDGEADFYENFNNDEVSDANYHSFHYDLQTDHAGNFYYAITGNQMAYTHPDSGCVVKVSKYGDKLEVLATGLRAANGLGMGPNDELSVADNQGHWVPASPIFMVKPGAFFGYHGDPRNVTEKQFAEDQKKRPHDDPPLCWVPYKWDNSSGGQVWAPSNFGPLSNHMLHLSYGTASMFEVLGEQVGGVWQGGVVPLGLKFDSGAMRGRVNPVDQSVWVCGVHGWTTAGAKDGCLQRVRYTGKPFVLPTEMHVKRDGIALTFPVALDPETAKDAGAYSMEVWTYHRTETYGSPDYKISNPEEKGRDSLDVSSVDLSPDRKTVTIHVNDLKPVTQYLLSVRIHAADGTPIKADIGGTINVLK